jgi:hypothetical protein
VQRVHFDVDVLPSFMADGACRRRQHSMHGESTIAALTAIMKSTWAQLARTTGAAGTELLQSFVAARLSCSDSVLLRWCTCAAGLR